MPLPIVLNCVPTVLIESLPAATVTSQTAPCMLISCVPGGPGMVAQGSMTVLIGGKPAARAGDLIAFAACVAPLPAPTGKILPPCALTVIIDG